MAKTKSKVPENIQGGNMSDSSSEDGVRIYTPPETEVDDLAQQTAKLNLTGPPERSNDDIWDHFKDLRRNRKDVGRQMEERDGKKPTKSEIMDEMQYGDSEPSSTTDAPTANTTIDAKSRKARSRKKKSTTVEEKQTPSAKEKTKETTATAESQKSKTKKKKQDTVSAPTSVPAPAPAPAHALKQVEAKSAALDVTAKPKVVKTKKNNVVGQWDDYFGNDTQLANWQRLCVDVGMEEIPGSISKCRKALGKVWVNIFDFLDAKAAGTPVKRFKSQRQLASYTLQTRKIYPKKHAKQGGPAKVLLAHIFS